MKTLVFTIILLLGAVQFIKAQDEKPTKEETIEYIENYFKNDFFTNGERFDAGYSPGESLYMQRLITITDVNIMGCILRFSYKITSDLIGAGTGGRPQTENFTNYIDLSEVESISLKRKGEQYFVYGLVFNEKNSPDSREPDLPFTRTDEDFDEIVNLQIYKAFNHLRKLCGAPEPISFD
ncbi:hypothetical protein [Parapedobacter sp. DT-150]|uniref:hypothetical protein n=1 Tax=Parapedobacter sp. DT-150 TaxID=3396162 RepID=UPI003F1C908D